MAKGKILCKQSPTGHGVVFECENCGKSLFVNSLCKRRECMRCGIKLKPIIKIERIDL